MNPSRFPPGAADTIRLRTVVAEIARELSYLPPSEEEGVPAIRPLRRSWAELVELLALGPAPETRLCPICGNVGMRAATRCGHCWNKLSPLAVDATDAPGTPAVG